MPSTASAPIKPAKANATHNGFDVSIKAVAERLLKQMERKGRSGEEIEQRRRFFGRFVEATGVTDIRELNQGHLAHFVDLMQQMPVHYHRSPKDREKSILQIIKDAPKGAEKLSNSTINKNLALLGQLIRKARSEGMPNVLIWM